MEIKAQLNYLRMAPRKVRLAIDMIRGKKVLRALDVLSFSKRWAAAPVLKLLQSSIANAENNFSLKKEDLYVKIARVDGGPMLKRWAPKAHGRATPVRKRMSHITIILDELKKPLQESQKSKIKSQK